MDRESSPTVLRNTLEDPGGQTSRVVWSVKLPWRRGGWGMTAQGVASVIDWLTTQQVFSPEQLAEVTDSLRLHFTDGAALAAELVARGWLTPFQAAQFARGAGVRLGSYLLLECLGKGGQGEVFK